MIRKPTSILVIQLMIYIQIALLIVILLANVALVVVPDHAWSGWDAFKSKQLELLQIPAYTWGMFGKAAIKLAIPLIILFSTIYSIWKKRYIYAVMLTIAMLVFSANPIQELLVGIAAVLFFTRSARNYFKGVDAKAAHAPDGGESVIDVEGETVAEDDGEPSAERTAVQTPKAKSYAEPEVTIREATPSDADTIHSLMLLAFEEYRAAIPPSTALDETSDGIEQALRENKETAVILYEDDAAVAMVRYRIEGDMLYFFRLSVVPAKRRRGYAKRLIKHLEQMGKAQGLARSRCKVRQAVQNNLAMYQDLGYEIVDQELVVRPAGAVKTLTLEKSLVTF
jgi:ribosomal protein S18 acetylase RimI-like enzyme